MFNCIPGYSTMAVASRDVVGSALCLDGHCHCPRLEPHLAHCIIIGGVCRVSPSHLSRQIVFPLRRPDVEGRSVSHSLPSARQHPSSKPRRYSAPDRSFQLPRRPNCSTAAFLLLGHVYGGAAPISRKHETNMPSGSLVTNTRAYAQSARFGF